MSHFRSLLGLVTKQSERRTGPSKRPQPFRPALEALEARDAPSGLAHGHTTTFCDCTPLFGTSWGKTGPDGFCTC
jgi:hypothetical protein